MSELVYIGSLTDKVSISETGLSVVSELSYDQWSTLMQTLYRMDTAFQFALGDALNYGENRYGERYAQAMEVTGHSYQSLANYAWVSKAVPIDRRVTGLSWTHHRIVARLDSEQQALMLQRALTERMTVTALGEEVRGKPVDKVSELIPVPDGMSPRDAEATLHNANSVCHELCETCPFRK
jgi:hypothetical protein